ncbi:MAG: hypothetical protein ACQETB_06320 [Halobacteriota archaeon]
MHTARELTNDAFAYYRHGEPVDRSAVLPAITVADRLGVVMAEPSDGLGAGNFVLACVTAFYDRLREQAEDFYEYPDYFTFQAGAGVVDYLEFDIWPAHKHVAVPPDPEQILQAVNDRAVNVLLVPTNTTTNPEIADVTLNSARRRVDACYLYAPNGTVENPDCIIEVAQDPAARWYREMHNAIDDQPAFRIPVDEETPIRQSFCRIDLADAIERLPDRTGP